MNSFDISKLYKQKKMKINKKAPITEGFKHLKNKEIKRIKVKVTKISISPSIH